MISLQEFQSKRRTSKDGINLYVGNGVRVIFELIGVVNLTLESGYELVLENTLIFTVHETEFDFCFCFRQSWLFF